MAHTKYCGTRFIYTNDIAVFLNTGSVYGILTAVVLQSILDLFYNEKHVTMTKYDDRYDKGYDDGKRMEMMTTIPLLYQYLMV